MKPLKTGTAYHGNRMLSHAIEDMRRIAAADMDIVVHMLSHNDWERHDTVMADIFKATESFGLEVWVDNWGIGGAPGDKCHFLAYHPEAHSYYGDGIMHPYQICLNAPSYREFVKNWLHKVVEIGGKTVFWDEPFIPHVKIEGTDNYYSACTCPTCRKMFEDRFGKKMPTVMDADVAKFRNDTLVEFHGFMTEYANSLGLKNVICLMPYQLSGMTQGSSLLSMDISKICEIPYIDNIGTDPYWVGTGYHPYEYAYNSTRACVETADKYGKDHNIWIQTYNNPRGSEDEIIEAFHGAYDGGARTILTWSYNCGESNSYRAECTERAWARVIEGNRRVKSIDRDRILAENRKKYMT